MRSFVQQTKRSPSSSTRELSRRIASERRTLGSQAKLTVNRPGDKYEQEADRVAERVTSMGQASGFVELSSTPWGLQRICTECVEEEEEELQRMPDPGGRLTAGSSDAVLRAQQETGRPLTTAERVFFEPRMGFDFSRVRIHSGPQADAAARSVAARAYTLGTDIVLRSGAYTPWSDSGGHLLAHELTHVVQQGGAGEKRHSGSISDFSSRQDGVIQRQEGPDTTITEEISPDPEGSSATRPTGGSPRVNRCYTNPLFPDFRCLAYALKLDIDENLQNNAHHFFRAASLFPDDDQLMWDTFVRYGLGVNLLQTSFGFLGAGETLGTILSYGTGIGLKSYDFFQNGVLELDVPIPLGGDVNLDLKVDLESDPDDLGDVREASAVIGISGSHDIF